MYEEYLTAMANSGDRIGDMEVVFDRYHDITVFKDEKIICNFFITDDYKTLKVDTGLIIEDKDLIVCMTMMFLTIKELNMMISTLSKAFTKTLKNTSDTDKSLIKDNRKFVPTSSLPKDIKNTIAKISRLQKSILSENEKYKINKSKDDKEDK
jgi:hypothetical protein